MYEFLHKSFYYIGYEHNQMEGTKIKERGILALLLARHFIVSNKQFFSKSQASISKVSFFQIITF